MVTFKALQEKKEKIAVVGLGYVGLPLAVHLAQYFSVVGFDVKEKRVEELKHGHDKNLEVEDALLRSAAIEYSADPARLAACRLIIVAVPTPIDEHNIPDLWCVEEASRLVGKNLKSNSCVVFESTVYPGVTEDVCGPILEQASGLKLGKDFTLGYSPERINPGDKKHTLATVMKIVSGSDQATTDLLASVYGAVVKAGIHQASSIKVAEAAKVIENTQRDLNIALMNELSKIFSFVGIDTREVLEAAGTKWNFLPFQPGLVGGHCIGVDPYYLTFQAEALGYHPEIILAGRRINDGMGKYIAEKTIKMLIAADQPVRNATVAVLGITFKENVPDLRNTKVIDIIKELQDYDVRVVVDDPMAYPDEAEKYYRIKLTPFEQIGNVDAVILAVAHDKYKALGMEKIAALCKPAAPVLIDVKSLFTKAEAEKRKIRYWRL